MKNTLFKKFTSIHVKLGIESFMRNGVRRSLIPLLTSYFQNQRMSVKWNGVFSDFKTLNGGGPQGALWGILEYLSISNNNTNYISRNEKFKFIEDLSILEKINLLSIGLSSYNFQLHVASDIIQDGYFIDSTNLETQEHLGSKSNLMLFKFTRDFKCSTRLELENEFLETIDETKLLGDMINNTLYWDINTAFIVKRANARMIVLHKLVEFNVPTSDLLTI